MLTQNQIDEVCKEVAARKNVIGVLLCGSYIYGEPTDESDLDVRAVTSDGFNADERDTWRFGHRIELFVNSPERIRCYFRECVTTGRPHTVHFWAHGRVILDPTGIVSILHREAKAIWLRGPDTGKWEHRKDKWRNRPPVAN